MTHLLTAVLEFQNSRSVNWTGFPIQGPFSNPRILVLESANPRIPGYIPGLEVSKKNAKLLAYKFLQPVFLSVK